MMCAMKPQLDARHYVMFIYCRHNAKDRSLVVGRDIATEYLRQNDTRLNRSKRLNPIELNCP